MAGSSSHLRHYIKHSFILESYQSAYHNNAFCLPNALFFLPNPFPFSFHMQRQPSCFQTGGSESGRSTPSLSTYSDGKSPSSASTYVAAPRHFHIPGRPRLHNLGRSPLLTFPASLHRGLSSVTRSLISWWAMMSCQITKTRPAVSFSKKWN